MTENTNMRKYLYFFTPYLISTGVFYLWGYWHEFDIPVLYYIEISDIFKITAYPLVVVSISLILGVIFAVLNDKDEDGSQPAVDEGDIFVKIFLHIKDYKNMYAMGYIVVVVIVFLSSFKYAWYIVSILVAIPTYIFIGKTGFFDGLISNEKVNKAFLLLLCIFPLAALSNGKSSALSIKDSTHYNYLVSGVENIEYRKNTEEKMRFLGSLADYFFFYDPLNKNTIIIKSYDGIVVSYKKNNSN